MTAVWLERSWKTRRDQIRVRAQRVINRDFLVQAIFEHGTAIANQHGRKRVERIERRLQCVRGSRIVLPRMGRHDGGSLPSSRQLNGDFALAGEAPKWCR